MKQNLEVHENIEGLLPSGLWLHVVWKKCTDISADSTVSFITNGLI
jgi:hypothetical protein